MTTTPVRQHVDDDLYLDPRTPVTTISTTVRRADLPPNAPAEVVSTDYVNADDFMRVQAEANHLRKTVALINAWRVDPSRSEERLRTLLERAGETDSSGAAMLGLVRWALSQDRP